MDNNSRQEFLRNVQIGDDVVIDYLIGLTFKRPRTVKGQISDIKEDRIKLNNPNSPNSYDRSEGYEIFYSCITNGRIFPAKCSNDSKRQNDRVR